MLFRKEKRCLLRKLFTIVVLLFAPFFIALNTTSVFASNTPFSVYWRSYYTLQSGIVNQSDAITGTNTSAKIVGYNPVTSEVVLLGVSMDFAVDDDTEYKYKQMVVKSELYQPSTNGNTSFVVPMPSRLSMNTTSGSKTSTNCGIVKGTDISGNINTQKAVVTCSIVWDDYGTTSNAQLVLGTIQNASQLSQMIAVANSQYDADIYISAVEYNLSGSNDPSLLQLQQISNAIIAMNNKENQAVDNIEGQSTSDISNSESSQTTSIIGTISSFVTALGTVQTGSCELTLPFPQFIGGNTTVNPCTGKDKAPTIVQVGSSMFLIGVFIPFAFMILKMIYNEIRSFTNG